MFLFKITVRDSFVTPMCAMWLYAGIVYRIRKRPPTAIGYRHIRFTSKSLKTWHFAAGDNHASELVGDRTFHCSACVAASGFVAIRVQLMNFAETTILLAGIFHI